MLLSLQKSSNKEFEMSIFDPQKWLLSPKLALFSMVVRKYAVNFLMEARRWRIDPIIA